MSPARSRSWQATALSSSPVKPSGLMAGFLLVRFGHTSSLRRSGWWPFGGGRPLADVIKLEAAEWTPVNISADPFLQITQRVLVHRVDVVDAAQFLHSKASAARTAAGPSEQE